MASKEESDYPEGEHTSRQVRMRLLEQMAEALEDQASGLSRRAAGQELEQSILCREIDERNTEISRLQLKLESIQAERKGLLQRIEALRQEASSLREQFSRSSLLEQFSTEQTEYSSREPDSAEHPLPQQFSLEIGVQFEASDASSHSPQPQERWDQGRESTEPDEVRTVYFHRMTMR